MELFAATAPGIAQITAGELREMGLDVRERLPDGVLFTGGFDILARANVSLRTASRVLVRMGSFGARTFAELERHAKKLDWRSYATPGSAARFRVTARKCRLYHTAAIAERLHTASRLAQAGDIGNGTPDPQLFVVRGYRDEWTVSADSSGEHLHRRGYRLATAKAPVRETLAAAAVLASGWDRASPLVDPFCGSGTICIEAALIALGRAPGASREFAFTRWPAMIGNPRAQIPPERRSESFSCGYDRDAGAVESAVANAQRAAVADVARFAQQPLSAFQPPAERGWIVTNPPYGVRVGERGPLRDLYARFGSIVRERCAGWTVGFFSADPVLERATRLSLQPLFSTESGGLPVRLMTTGEV